MKRLVAGSLVCHLFLGCGAPSDPQTSQPGHPQTAEELPGSFAAALCESAAKCCAEQHLDYVLDECKVQLTARIKPELEEDSQGLRVVFDPEAAATCIDGWANLFCPERPVDYNPKSACNHIFAGLQALGEPCEREVECARAEDGSWPTCPSGKCVTGENYVPPSQDEACSGTCHPALGDPGACESSLFEPTDLPPADSSAPFCLLSDGLQCWTTDDGSSTCQPALKEGESCAGHSHSCELSAFCNLETGLCEARRESGTCNDSSECSAQALCDSSTLECVPRPKQPGDSCSRDAECDGGQCGPTGTCRLVVNADFCSMPIDLR